MNAKRIKEVFKDYRKALKRLEESLAEDITKSKLVVDGTIQRFEFTFELAWKLARVVLDYHAIIANSPRSAIKEAYKMELIKNGNQWIDMLKDRNITIHIYNEKDALKIYRKIKKIHFKNFKDFEATILKLIKEF
jgi:nucleotidyltransferase substrate binding protein (TIGR01987 family)